MSLLTLLNQSTLSKSASDAAAVSVADSSAIVTDTFKYKVPLTIDYTKVSGGDKTNFVVLVDVILNTAHVSSSSGYDVKITDASNNDLSFDLESYNSSTGRWVGWVKVPTLSSTVNTVINVVYGNAAQNQNLSSTSTWSSYRGVWFLSESSLGTSVFKDRTSNQNHMSSVGTALTAGVSGKITNALNRTGDATQLSRAITDANVNNPSGGLNVMAWSKTNADVQNGNAQIVWEESSGRFRLYSTGGQAWSWRVYQTSGTLATLASLNANQQWHHVGLRVSPTDGASFSYLDGSQVSTSATVTSYIGTNSQVAVLSSSTINQGANDAISHLMISDDLGAGWVTTAYNNQNLPANFYSTGSEQSLVITPISASDSCAITITDASSSTSTLSRTDTTAVSVSDIATLTKQFSSTDTAAISVTDTVTEFSASYPYLYLNESFEGGSNTFDNTVTGGSSTVSIGSGTGYGGTYGATFNFADNGGGVNYAYLKKHISGASASGFVKVGGWFKFTTAASATPIVTLTLGTSLVALLYKDSSNNLVFYDYSNGDDVIVGATVPLNTWTRIEFIQSDDGSRTLNVNGTVYNGTAISAIFDVDTAIIGQEQYTIIGGASTMVADNIYILASDPPVTITPVAGSESPAISVSDVASTQVSTSRTETPAVSVSDVSSHLITSSRTDAAAVSVAEVSSVMVSITANDTCAVSVSETRTLDGFSTTTDATAVSVADSSAVAIINAVAASDTAAISIADSSSNALSLSRTDTTAVSASDVSTSASTLNRTETPAVSVADVSSLAGSSTSTDASAVSVSDVATIVVSHSRADATAVSVAETSSVAVTQPTADTSAVSVSESTALAGSSTSTDTTAISVSEVASIVVTQSSTDAAAISVAETSSVAGTVSTTDAAAISINDISNANVNTPGQEAPAVSVTESANLLVFISTSDTSAISVSDTSSVAATLFITANDTAAVSVAESVNVQKPITASDTAAVSITESTSLDSFSTSNDSANISVTESATQFLAFTSTDASALSINDNYGGTNVSLTANDTASVTISESFSKFVSLSTSDTGTITISETTDFVMTNHSTSFYVYVSGEWLSGGAFVYLDGEWREILAYSYEAIGWS